MSRRAAGAALVAVEIAGCVLMWLPIPWAWMWIGGRVYRATGSLMADLTAAFGGFCITVALTMGALNRIDGLWVQLRRSAGHEQRDGALTQVVVVSSTIAMAAFWVWFHILKRAFIIPFMPNH